MDLRLPSTLTVIVSFILGIFAPADGASASTGGRPAWWPGTIPVRVNAYQKPISTIGARHHPGRRIEKITLAELRQFQSSAVC